MNSAYPAGPQQPYLPEVAMPAAPAAPVVAPPPPGPGVTPPFPAPPVEGRATRMWIGIGVASLAVLLCCGGGTAAIIGLVITGTQAINEQATAAAQDYLEDLQAGRYAEAYDSLCPRMRQQETVRQFADRLAAEPRIAEYDINDAELSTEIVVPVTVSYTTGGTGTLRLRIEQDQGSGELEVCGLDE